jgi:PleD family two-component response regulator
VIVDLSLPDARGLEAVLAIRIVAPEFPVVVLTGVASDSLGREALQAGAQDYLVKGLHLHQPGGGRGGRLAGRGPARQEPARPRTRLPRDAAWS